MRITETMMQTSYLSNLNSVKEKMALLQKQIVTGKKIEKPSDSPVGTSRLIRISDQIGQTQTYLNNIENSLSFLDETTFALQTMQTETLNVLGKLTDLENPINQTDLNLYADTIDNSLKLIMDVANSQTDGKYIFGGTDYAENPYGYSDDNQSIDFKTDVTGDITVKTSSSTLQKINVTGNELFGTIVSMAGSLDKLSPNGTQTIGTTPVYDSYGNEYTLTSTFEKTADNTYQFTYDITDSNGDSVFTTPPAANELVFNSTTGRVIGVNGSTSTEISINVPDSKINFTIDFDALKESETPTGLVISANQQTDIFNLLKGISDNLRNGILPTPEQKAAVEAFNSHLLSTLSSTGNVINQLTSLQSMLDQQMLDLQQAEQDVNGVDVEKAIIDLQNQDYMLQLSNQLASMILPMSLMDYL